MVHRWGLALGGGGVPGIAAHLGFLSVLDRNGLVPEIVVGSSAGGIVAGSLAAGIPLEELEAFWKSLARDEWRFFGSDVVHALDLLHPSPTPGLLMLDTIIRASLRGAHAPNVAGWVSGYGVTVTNLSDLAGSSSSVVVSRDTGDLGLSTAQALTATAAFPLVFRGVRTTRGDLLCDGGLYDMVPVDACRAMGAEQVVSVAIGLPPGVPPDLDLGRLAEIVVSRSLERANHSTNVVPAQFALAIMTSGGLLSLDAFVANFEAGVATASVAVPAILALASNTPYRADPGAGEGLPPIG